MGPEICKYIFARGSWEAKYKKNKSRAENRPHMTKMLMNMEAAKLVTSQQMKLAIICTNNGGVGSPLVDTPPPLLRSRQKWAKPKKII